ncbi:MAG: MFS transporter [Acidobacteriaceae bacterium]|jgi:multidrug resistance protein|nr:MFS transporter [Acidobacteriaceae bacterium]
MSWRRSRPVAVTLVTCATFTDILAYGTAVPVLPEVSRRFGASPADIGFLFASFGVMLLLASIPLGAISDRIGRTWPMAGGLLVLAVSSVLFAFAPAMPWLYAARMAQGAADATAWVVGFAIVADLYQPDERGRVMGWVMSGSTFGFMTGPTLGGWLYQLGGPRLPYLVIAAVSAVVAVLFLRLELPDSRQQTEAVPLRRLLRTAPVRLCAIAVTVGGGSIAMLEPVLSLFLNASLGLSPGRIGMVFGVGALCGAMLHPVFGRFADRVGGRTLTLYGLLAVSLSLPLLTFIHSFTSALLIQPIVACAIAVLVTPSLSYMAEAMQSVGSDSFGVAYGIYNGAWALGILVGPSLGGVLYERVGFSALILGWAAGGVLVTGLLARATRSSRPLGMV